MNIVNVKGSDEFKLKTVIYIEDAAGKKRMCCNYERFIGPKNSLSITFEGYAKHDTLRVKETYTFKSLMSMFDDRRIYLKGALFLDEQFKNENS